ncbi:RNA pseudouridine synthase, partial [Vibrio sp. M260118]
MHHHNDLFTRFESDIESLSLPEKFTFPFYYQPHPLCELAAKQLQLHLATQQGWQHDFGLDGNPDGTGKMFGVLVVQSPSNEIGYFSAFSGKIAEQNLLPGFVPPVFDMLAEESFFHSDLAQITVINQSVNELKANPNLLQLKET